MNDRVIAFQQRQLRLQADSDAIEEFKLILINEGFDIIPDKKWQQPPYSYFSCHKDNAFLYIQKNELTAGWSVSSIYIPSKQNGSGKRLIESADLTIDTVNLAMSMKQSFNSDLYLREGNVKFYKSLEHYMTSHKNDFN